MLSTVASICDFNRLHKEKVYLYLLYVCIYLLYTCIYLFFGIYVLSTFIKYGFIEPLTLILLQFQPVESECGARTTINK